MAKAVVLTTALASALVQSARDDQLFSALFEVIKGILQILLNDVTHTHTPRAHNTHSTNTYSTHTHAHTHTLRTAHTQHEGTQHTHHTQHTHSTSTVRVHNKYTQITITQHRRREKCREREREREKEKLMSSRSKPRYLRVFVQAHALCRSLQMYTTISNF